jgi:hypothetical protein
MTDNVLKPDAFNERFTFLDADGKPVQRTLREMTADEVMAALVWQDAEMEHWSAEAGRHKAVFEAVDAGKELTKEQNAALDAALDALEEMEAAIERMRRLFRLVRAIVPEGPKALRSAWPGGRHAA